MVGGTTRFGEYRAGRNGPLKEKPRAHSGRLNLTSSGASRGHETPSRGGVFLCWTLRERETFEIKDRSGKCFESPNQTRDPSTEEGRTLHRHALHIIQYIPARSNDLLGNSVDLLVSCVILFEAILATEEVVQT